MKKWWATLNEKTRGGNGCWTFLHSKLFQNDFVFFEKCYSMNENNAIKKLQRLVREIVA